MTILIDRPIGTLDAGGGPPGPRGPDGGGGEPPHRGPRQPLHAFRLTIWLAMLIVSPLLAVATFATFVPKHLPPAITNPPTASATVGAAFSFQVTDVGPPKPAVRLAGMLPKGLTFSPGRNTIRGTPGPGSAGTYPITVIATNPLGTASQFLVLTVKK